MHVCLLRFVPAVLLLLPFTAYAWISQRTTPRQRLLFNGSTKQRSSNPRLSGELLPQGIVDSSTVYRGGLIEKPQWNGAPAEGFREAQSIQNMYYALSTFPEKETKDERDEIETNTPSLLEEKNILDDENEVPSEASELDHTDTFTEETIEAVVKDDSFATKITDLFETNDQILSASDELFAEEDGSQVSGETTTDESAEEDEIFYDYSLENMEAPFESTDGDPIAINDSRDLYVARTEEMDETEDDRGIDESLLSPDESGAIDTESEDGGLQLLSLQSITDNEVADEIQTSMEAEEDTITSAESDLLTEAENVDGTFRDELVEELGATLTEDAKEHEIVNGSRDAIVESSINELTQPELSAEPMNLENQQQLGEETTILSLKADGHHESDLTSSEFFGEKQQSVESRAISGASTLQIVEASTTMNSIALSKRPLKRIPLFQKMNIDAAKESAFLRVVRRYTEADKRRRKLLEERRMAESINGLEDVDALNDLFKKLTSAGIIPRVKMYGKRFTLDDGTTAIGKRRKLCIELEWEME
ncbi:hypothetical protein FisN_23Hh012 [Fistulifera solaris]|jgi:hypothetical protein|uniref:Uncharacterized protein n=1 Tax=Fistulifera solaris TaxID=1519565 RepID=A0A1Z5KMK0_FISSO|nr:hypothetical protein FisN_23Hh012 [Fistulifera solaris]|eukprot:GAX27519.1 hypothetical protein FisN_23Hh012 [Fistulifera solaris]